jgi:predicted kinase
MSERVYATVAERATMTIREGHSTIVDAVYARPRDRRAIERVAADAAVPFVGIWLEAPETTLITRIQQRGNDASDADAAVVRLQHRDGTGVMEWHRVEASRPLEVVTDEASTHVHRLVPRVFAQQK